MNKREGVFVELCSGSAAVTLALVNKQKPIVSFAGGKAGYTHEILSIFGSISPTSFFVNDAGNWGRTWRCIVADKKEVEMQVLLHSEENSNDARQWAIKTLDDDNANESHRSAAHLYVVASTYGGFERGGFKGRHKHRPNVDGFIPSRQTIYERLKNLTLPNIITATNKNALDIDPFPACVYIDPPYNGTTKYTATLSRQDVIQTALRWKEVGSLVVVSECEPIKELVALGWKTVEITNKRHGQKRTNTKSSQEWLTFFK